MRKRVRIGTRTSPLALRQVDEIINIIKTNHPDLEVEISGIDTHGDKNKSIPISDMEGTDFFTREIDVKLIKGEIDFGIHSAKDLPDKINCGLIVAGMTDSIDPYDVLVSKDGLELDELLQEAKIGTSSVRRKEQLKKYRNDFNIIDIRGNIEERLKILDRTDLDAIVIAAAGLIRLGLEHRITQRIPLDILTPHPLQGRLAIVVEKSNEVVINVIKKCFRQESVNKNG